MDSRNSLLKSCFQHHHLTIHTSQLSISQSINSLSDTGSHPQVLRYLNAPGLTGLTLQNHSMTHDLRLPYTRPNSPEPWHGLRPLALIHQVHFEESSDIATGTRPMQNRTPQTHKLISRSAHFKQLITMSNTQINMVHASTWAQ